MTRQLVLKQVIALFYLLLWVSPAIAQQNFINALNRAFEAKSGMPHISSFKPSVDKTTAYQIQKAFVKSRVSKDPIAGYKAGLTSLAGQKKFAVSEALSGVLFASGNLSSRNSARLSDAGRLMLETEIGFILSKDINRPVIEMTQLKQYVNSVVSVIELPDLAFENPKQIKGVDLMAANLASHQFIVGEPRPLSDIKNINQITTQLSLGNQVLFQGTATDALGDQWSALQWLINHLIAQGYQLKAGDLLITGALGKMLVAKTGHYSAEFGELGLIEFTITP